MKGLIPIIFAALGAIFAKTFLSDSGISLIFYSAICAGIGGVIGALLVDVAERLFRRK